jgi:hypothetical protein
LGKLAITFFFLFEHRLDIREPGWRTSKIRDKIQDIFGDLYAGQNDYDENNPETLYISVSSSVQSLKER